MKSCCFISLALRASLPALVLLGLAGAARAEENALLRPSKLARTPLGNLLVAEVGTTTSAPNTGRVSIIDPDGGRRTLLEGLPSAPLNAVNTPSGPSGLYLQGRTLLVVIGEGNPTLAGPVPRTEVPNPAPASPLFSCVLAVHFTAAAEARTDGVALSLQDHHALKAGAQLVREDAAGHKMTIELVVDFPDYVAEPVPALAANVRHSHPYGVVADDEFLYVVDGGYNAVHKVDVLTGEFATLVSFPRTPNPGSFGPPLIENVPTSIRWDGDRLLVTLLSGFPFIAGLSQVRAIDPETGDSVVLIAGLSSAIDIIPLTKDDQTVGYLTLEYSLAHLAGGPGRLILWDEQVTPTATLASGLTTPSSMVHDRKANSVTVAELVPGRLITVPLP